MAISKAARANHIAKLSVLERKRWYVVEAYRNVSSSPRRHTMISPQQYVKKFCALQALTITGTPTVGQLRDNGLDRDTLVDGFRKMGIAEQQVEINISLIHQALLAAKAPPEAAR